MKRKIIFTAVIVLAASGSFAQSFLKGTVTDAKTNLPLVGATIGYAQQHVVTTSSGTFSIPCMAKGQIVVSFVGYETVKISLAGKDCNRQLLISLNLLKSYLDEVEITATSNQNKALLYQPVSITKLNQTELNRSTGLFLDDAINGNVPGVTMQRRAVSSGQQFNIRGYGNGSRGTRGISSNFDGQGYKVYLNGIPVTDAEGITTLDDIDFGSIGNVEVVKGPSGTLYGLAIAGVVNLKTVKPEKGKTSVGQDILIGNYGLQRYSTHFAMAGDKSSWVVNYGHQLSDGFTIHNSSHKDFINVAGDFQPTEKQTVSTYFGYSNSYDERSGELTIGQFDTANFSGNIEYIKRNGHSKVYTVRAGIGHTYNFNNHLSNSTTIFGTSFNSNVSSAGGWTDKAATNFGVRSTFDTKFLLRKGVSLSGITGVETQRQNATTIGYGMIDPLGASHLWKLGDPYFIIGSTTAGSNGITSDLYVEEATTSLFTEWTLALPTDFSITAGIGYSNMKIKLDDRFYVANKPTHYDTTYNKMFSPHLAINKVFSKECSVYASYSKAYKAPVSSYFFIPYTAAGGPETGIVNNKLKPEIGNQFEIGTKGALMKSKLIYLLALFEAVFSDKMTTLAVPFNSSTTLYSYVTNGGKQEDKGIEALVKYAAYQSPTGFISKISPFANLTYSDFKYKDFKFQSFAGTTVTTMDYSDQAVAGVAKFVGNIGIDMVTRPGLHGSISYFYKDGMPITSDGIFRTGSYSLLNAKIGFQYGVSRFDFDLYVGVNNITNTKYPIMVFVNQIPDAYMAAPLKANYFGGLNLKYNF